MSISMRCTSSCSLTITSGQIVVASLGSLLELRPTEILRELLRAVDPEIQVDVLTVSTKGDKDKSIPFSAMGAKGIFTTEVSGEVLAGNADVALHSAKDLTAELAANTALICIPPRADARDVVVGGQGVGGEERLGSLPTGARVGTSSMRRKVLLTEARPDLEVVEFRGNLDTRLRKVAEGEVDAAILAAAGIQRLRGVDEDLYGPLEPTRWVPSPAQGALAVEALTERSDLAELFGRINSPGAAARIAASTSPSATLRSRVSRFPRNSTTSRSGRASVRSTFRRMLDVPTRAPVGSDPSRSSPPTPWPPTTTSRASARGGMQIKAVFAASSAVRSLAECSATSALPASTSPETSVVKIPLAPIALKGMLLSLSPFVLTVRTSI